MLTRRSFLRGTTGAAIAVATTVALAACGSSSDSPLGATASGGNSDPNSIVVGSANFTESVIIGEIYVAALKANGFTVTFKGQIGSREVYVNAVKSHEIDVIPEYAGNLLSYLDPKATATSPTDVEAALPAALGADLSVYKLSAAADADTLSVTKATADKWGLKTIADLVKYNAQLTVSGAPEFQTRTTGLVGLKEKYGLAPSKFIAIGDGGGPSTVKSLTDGQAQAANIYSTSPAIKTNNLVALEDPKFVFPAGNVLPLLATSKKSDKLEAVLNKISETLTTEDLIDLNDRVEGTEKAEADKVAADWVAAKGLDKPVG